LRMRWEGPYRVIQVFKNGVEVDLTGSSHTRLTTVWSNEHIRKYVRRERPADDSAGGVPPAGGTDSVAGVEQPAARGTNQHDAERVRESSDSESSSDDDAGRFRKVQRLAPREHSPVILDHVCRMGSYFYYIRFAPHEPPEMVTRAHAFERCHDALLDYERRRFPQPAA
jgi:hypothetical protein